MTTKYWPDPNRYDTITTACAIGVLPNAATVHTGKTELPHSEHLTVTVSLTTVHLYFLNKKNHSVLMAHERRHMYMCL